MNQMKDMRNDIKKGDTVICVERKPGGKNGSGYKLGKKFIVDHIDINRDSIVYFPNIGNGCFREEIEKVCTNWKEKFRC